MKILRKLPMLLEIKKRYSCGFKRFVCIQKKFFSKQMFSIDRYRLLLLGNKVVVVVVVVVEIYTKKWVLHVVT